MRFLQQNHPPSRMKPPLPKKGSVIFNFLHSHIQTLQIPLSEFRISNFEIPLTPFFCATCPLLLPSFQFPVIKTSVFLCLELNLHPKPSSHPFFPFSSKNTILISFRDFSFGNIPWIARHATFAASSAGYP